MGKDDLRELEPDIGEKRHAKTFTGFEQYWIKHKESHDETGYSPKQLRNSVDDKIENIDSNIQYFIDDLYLLDNSDYVKENSPYNHKQIWANITSIQSRYEPHSERGFFTVPHLNNGSILTGYELAQSLRSLHPPELQAWEDFLWGFLIGAIDQPGLTDRQEIAYQQHLFEYFKRKNRIRYNMSGRDEISRDFFLTLQPDVTVVEEVVIQSTIRPVQPVLHYIIESLEEQNLELSEENVRTELDNLFTDTDLEQVSSLSQIIEYDIDMVRNKNRSGPETTKILNCIWEKERPSKQIAQDLSTGVQANLVGTILEDLADTSEERVGEQPKYPIAKMKTTDDWTLTKYGQVLCYQLFEKEFDEKWIYYYSLYPGLLKEKEIKLITEALHETGLMDEDSCTSN